MQPKQAFPLFIALVSLITFSLNLSAQSDTLYSPKDSIVLNSADLVDKKLDTNQTDTSEVINSGNKSNRSKDAIDSKVNYTARDTIKYNFAEQKVFLYGDASVTFEDVQLNAEFIELKMDSNIVYATGVKDSSGKVIGSPVFKEGNQEYRSQRITYNFNTGKGIISEVITQEGEGYVHGESVKKAENNVIYIENGKYTTCEHADPHFSIAAKNLKIIPNDKIIARPANLIIEGIPTPVLLPFGIFPNRKRGKSGLIIPMPGEDARKGFFLRGAGYYFYLSERADLELEFDVYSKGSYTIRPSFTYKKRYKRSGSIRMRHINTVTGVIPEDPDYNIEKDFWFEWRHKQDAKARPNSNFSAAVSLGTTNSYKNDINTPDNDYLRGNFTSKITYSNDFLNNKLHFSLNARQTQNNKTGVMNLTLPEANLSMNRLFPFKSKKSLTSKWYDNLGISYNGNTRNELIFNSDSVKISVENFDTLRNSFKNGAQHNIPIGINFKLFKYLTLNPSFNYREIWYYETTEVYVDNNDSINERAIAGFSRANKWSVNANFTTKIYGMLQFKKGFIRAFRHVLTPSFGFSYTPENNQGLKSYTDNTGTESKEMEYSIYKNGIYGRPNTKESGKVNFSLLSSFEMKVKTNDESEDGYKKIKLLENLKLSTGYDFIKDSLYWDDISINGNSSISKQMNLVLGSAFDLYALKTDSLTGYYKSNDFEWDQNGKLARLKTGNIGLNYNFTGGKSKKKQKKSSDGFDGEKDDFFEDDYVDEFSDRDPETLRREKAEINWDVPWNLRIQFNLQYRQTIKGNLLENVYITNTQATGDLSLTKNWKITYNVYFDTQEMKINFANIGITRNLHCWEMTMNWTPIGENRKNYTFNIGVRANILSDLKLDKRSF